MKKLNNNIQKEEWLISKDRQYIQSQKLLDYGFKHAFFTRKTNRKSPEQLIDLLTQGYTIHKTKQIHSNKIINTSEATNFAWPKADAIISTTNKQQSLWVYSADCIPVLIADCKTGKVATVHCGWRGIQNQIIIKTILKIESYGSDRRNLIIILGPSIGLENYQVSQDIALQIYNSILFKDGLSNNDKIKKMNSHGITKVQNIPGKILLDIRIAAYYQLLKQGFNKEEIIINKLCTYKEHELFHSWRRDKQKQTQWSCIMSKLNNNFLH